MNSDAGLSDASLIDLFQAEVETHAEVLSAALLALERSPGDTSRFDEMMRAAHSIKGASRVVGVDPAARVAHFMEDCFVAAQKGTIQLLPGDVDVLLRGVDLLEKISAATKDPEADLERIFSNLVQELVGELQAMLTGTRKSSAVSTTSTESAVVPPRAATAPALDSEAHTEPAVRSSSASQITIAFPEILDSEAAEDIRRRILSAIDSRTATIRLDLRATRDLDIQGLTLLAVVPRHLAKHSRTSVEMTGVSSEMATVLRVTGLGEWYGVLRGTTREAE